MRTSIKPAIAGFLWAVLLLAVAGAAEAATIKLTCSLPTQYTDGTAIGTAAISIKTYWGTSATSMTTPVALSSCTAAPVTVPDPAPGVTATYYFTFTATVAGVESAKWSGFLSKAITTPLPTPKPPVGLSAEIGATAYSIKPDYTTFGPMKVAKAVGKVRAPTACIARQRIAGTELYRVPKSAVAFSKGATDYVVAQCRQS